MKFPNAYAGVKKIFTSEILHLISVLLMMVAAIAAVFGGAGLIAAGDSAAMTDAEAAAVLGGGFLSILAISAGAVIAIIAFILQIVGIGNAMKDEPYFKTAFIFVFVGIACTIVYSCFNALTPDNLFLINLFRALAQIANLVVFIYVVGGIQRLASKLGNADVESKGSTIFTLLIIIYLIAFVASIVSMFAPTVASILAICVLVLDLISYIIFLIYLSKAKNMLAE